MTPSNRERPDVNRAAVVAPAAAGLPVVRILATCTSAGRSVPDNTLRWLYFTADETRCDKLAPVLDVFPGQRVRVAKNVATQLGMANGTLATVAARSVAGRRLYEQLPTDLGGLWLQWSTAATRLARKNHTVVHRARQHRRACGLCATSRGPRSGAFPPRAPQVTRSTGLLESSATTSAATSTP